MGRIIVPISMKHFHCLQLFTVFIIVSFSSCNDDISANVQLNSDSVIVQWLDSLNIVASTNPDGFYYYADSLNPSGSQVGQAGQVVTLYYQLTDLDGNVIASHQRTDGDSLLYKYASNAVFPVSMDELIPLMRVGEIYHFILPPLVGYEGVNSVNTADGSGIVNLQLTLTGILSDADILTEELRQMDDYIQLNDLNDTISVAIERIDTIFLGQEILSIDTTFNYEIDSVQYFSSGVRYKLIEEGNGSTPLNGDLITIDYSAAFLDGSQFQSRSNFDIQVGSAIPNILIPGLEFGLSLMLPSERGLIIIPSSQAYRESALVIPPFIIPELIEDAVIPEYVEFVPPYKSIIFDVTRIN